MQATSESTANASTRHAAAEKLLEQTGSLSATPPVAFQVLAMARRPDYSAEDLIRMVELDPELTAQLLRHANTMHFRGRGVSTLREAIVRLGGAAIAETAISFTVGRLLSVRESPYCPDPAALWRHAVECALACRHLAPICPGFGWATDLAFTSGLLHDLGKIVINASPVKHLREVAALMNHDGLTGADAELAVLGTDHAEVGGTMLEHWNLPPEVCRAVKFHHAPEFDSLGLANLVHVGNCCAKVHAGSRGWDDFAAALQPYALERLRLPLSKVSDCWGEVLQDMDAIERFISK